MAAPALSDPLKLGHDISFSFLTDSQGQLSLENVTEKLRLQSLSERSTFSRGFGRGTFWLRFELPEDAFVGEDRWLELGPSFIDDIRLFTRPVASDEPWTSRRTGDLMYGQSDLDYRNPVFVLPPSPLGASGYEVIVRVQSSSGIIL